MNVKKIGAFLAVAALTTGIFANGAFAAEGPNTTQANPPKIKQTDDQKKDLRELHRLIQALKAENQREHSLRQQLGQDMKEIHRLVTLSRSAHETEDLKQAYAEVQRLREDLKVIRETKQQWKTEWAIFNDYRHHKHVDKAIAMAEKLKGILHLQIEQLEGANGKAHKLIADLKADLVAVGINPDGLK